MISHNSIKWAVVLLACLTALSCQNEELSYDNPKEHIIDASLGSNNTKASFYPNETLDLLCRWDGTETLRVYYRKVSGEYSGNVAYANISNVGENRMNAQFTYTPDSKWNVKDNDSYETAVFTANCNPALDPETGLIYLDARLIRQSLECFGLPVYYVGESTGGKIRAEFVHYYTYELLHIRNVSDKEMEFSLNGFEAEKIWYKKTASYDIESGESYNKSWTGVAPVEMSAPISIEPQGTKTIVSAYIPNGWKINDATMVATIDGKAIHSANKKSSDAVLKQGHAYHMYAVWDGKELKFIGGNIIEAEDISFSNEVLSTQIGRIEDAHVTLVPENASWDSIIIESSNPDVAYFQDGSIVAVHAGTAVITLSTWSGKSVSITVDVENQPIGDFFEVSKTSLEFGKVDIGSTATMTLTLTNYDDVDRQVNVSIPEEDFTTLNDVSFIVKREQPYELQVSFIPTKTGELTGMLAITSENLSGSISVSLNGTGVDPESGGEDLSSHEYVDLGLPSGTKWATCNIGASKPEEYGDYYAWGEIETKTDYSWETYKWCNGSKNSLTKYCTLSSFGTVDNKTVLDLKDDAAYVKWGENWRMPTDEELSELQKNCTLTWTSVNSVKGVLITSKLNGNNIFMPAAGAACASEILDLGGAGYILTSTLNTESPSHVLGVTYKSNSIYGTSCSRYAGRPIRPVFIGNETDDFYVDPKQLSFGDVEIGKCKTLSFNIINNGRSSINIHDIYIEDSNFTIDWIGGAVVPNETRTVHVTFTPDREYIANERFTVGNMNSSHEFTCRAQGAKVSNSTEYVDLGLPSGFKWATCNLGAHTPEEVGKFYGWGETMAYGEEDYSNISNYIYSGQYVKQYYDDETYKYFKWDGTYRTGSLGYKIPNGSYTKYTNGNDLLELEDDAAYQHLGEGWRMPTTKDIQELIDNTTFEVSGRNAIFKSKISGYTDKYIIIPIDGNRYQRSLLNTSYGYIWCSTGHQILSIHGKSRGITNTTRADGVHIRPIFTK